MHQAAAGLSIPKENIDKFIDYANLTLPKVELSYDVWEVEGDKEKVVLALADFEEHYITHFKEPLLLDKVFIDNNITILGQRQNTVKIDSDVELIRFRYAEELPNTGSLLSVIGRPSINRYMGMEKPQIIIEDWQEEEIVL